MNHHKSFISWVLSLQPDQHVLYLWFNSVDPQIGVGLASKNTSQIR